MYDAVEFGLSVETPEDRATAVGTIAGDRFSLTVSNDPDQPIEGTLAAAALQLAFLAALGPRPHPASDARVLVANGLAGLGRADILARWSAEDRAGTPLGREDVVIWTAYATWPSIDGSSMIRTTTVADAGDQGIAIVDAQEEGVIVRPCTGVDVWTELCGLLPYPFELARNVAGVVATA